MILKTLFFPLWPSVIDFSPVSLLPLLPPALMVHNAARVRFAKYRLDHIFHLLKILERFPTTLRIKSKLSTMAYQTLLDRSPCPLSEFICSTLLWFTGLQSTGFLAVPIQGKLQPTSGLLHWLFLPPRILYPLVLLPAVSLHSSFMQVPVHISPPVRDPCLKHPPSPYSETTFRVLPA